MEADGGLSVGLSREKSCVTWNLPRFRFLELFEVLGEEDILRRLAAKY